MRREYVVLLGLSVTTLLMFSTINAASDEVPFCISVPPVVYLNDTEDWGQLNNLPSDCAADNYVYGIDPSDNSLRCRADQGGAGANNDQSKNTSSTDPYLYNNTYTIFLNETYLNITIDDRNTDTTCAADGTCTTILYHSQFNATNVTYMVYSAWNSTNYTYQYAWEYTTNGTFQTGPELYNTSSEMITAVNGSDINLSHAYDLEWLNISNRPTGLDDGDDDTQIGNCSGDGSCTSILYHSQFNVTNETYLTQEFSNTTQEILDVLETYEYWNMSWLIHHGNLTLCGEGEILKVNGGVWSCEADATGGGGGAGLWQVANGHLHPNISGGATNLVNFTTLNVSNVTTSIINADDWSDVSITESQISDLSHTVNTDNPRSGDVPFLYNDSDSITFNVTYGNLTYVMWSHLNMTNETYLTSETDPVWTADKPAYMTYATWNATNTSYLTEIPASYMQYQFWNSTNYTYQYAWEYTTNGTFQTGPELYNTSSEMITVVNGSSINLTFAYNLSWYNISSRPAGLDDGDDDTQIGNCSGDGDCTSILYHSQFNVTNETYLTQEFSNTTEEMQDACGTLSSDGHGINFSYVDASNSYSIGVDCSDLVVSSNLTCSGEIITANLGYRSLTELQGAVSNDFHNLGGADDDTPDSDAEVPDDITITTSNWVNSTLGFNTTGSFQWYYNGTCGIIRMGGAQIHLCG